MADAWFKSLKKNMTGGALEILSAGPENEEAWQYTRERLLGMVIVGAVILGTLVLLPSSILTIGEGKWGMAAINFLAYEWLLCILLFRKVFSYRVQAISLCLLVYLIGIAIFYYLGPLRAGITYLFCFQVMASVLLGLRGGVFAGILNLLTLGGVGLMLSLGYMDFSIPQDHPLFRWLVISINFLFTNMVAAILIVAVSNGMARALKNEKNALARIKKEMEERTASDKALEASEERFQLALKGSNDGLFDWDLETGKVYYSPAWKTMIGLNEHAPRNFLEEWTKFVHPEDAPDAQARLIAYLRGKNKHFEIEFRMLCQDGKYQDFLCRAYGQRNPQNRVTRIVGTVANLSQIRRSEESMRETQARRQVLMEQSFQGVAIFTPDPYQLVSCNAAMEQILGYSLEELRSMDVDQMKKVVHEDDWPIMSKRLHRLMTGKPVAPKHEYRLFRKDGALAWIEAKARAVQYMGRPAVMAVFLDVTALKTLEEERDMLAKRLMVSLQGEEGMGTAAAPGHGGEGDGLDSTCMEDLPLPCGKERILLVDDEKPILDMTRQALERLGYQVAARQSSMDALADVTQNPDSWDLIITDYAMPRMTGDALTLKVHALRPALPVILCTGFSEKITEAHSRTLGMAAYMVKPVLMHELALVVRKVLDHPAKGMMPRKKEQAQKSPAPSPALPGPGGRAV